MNYSVCNVRLSELHSKQVVVPPWEVPILKALHSDVQVVDEQFVDRDPPEPADELARLIARYGGNKEESNTIVSQVYGTLEPGAEALGKEIDKAGKETRSKSAKGERLHDLDERQKAEREAFIAKQKEERKAEERDADQREAARARREEATARDLRGASSVGVGGTPAPIQTDPILKTPAKPTPR